MAHHRGRHPFAPMDSLTPNNPHPNYYQPPGFSQPPPPNHGAQAYQRYAQPPYEYSQSPHFNQGPGPQSFGQPSYHVPPPHRQHRAAHRKGERQSILGRELYKLTEQIPEAEDLIKEVSLQRIRDPIHMDVLLDMLDVLHTIVRRIAIKEILAHLHVSRKEITFAATVRGYERGGKGSSSKWRLRNPKWQPHENGSSFMCAPVLTITMPYGIPSESAERICQAIVNACPDSVPENMLPGYEFKYEKDIHLFRPGMVYYSCDGVYFVPEEGKPESKRGGGKNRNVGEMKMIEYPTEPDDYEWLD
ncbi:hypothetical protein GGS20DRAFT_463528 [Poronia punctata]|nr:hypothetical protein GGS20DRAFT_463528 [Poronia punctata]